MSSNMPIRIEADELVSLIAELSLFSQFPELALQIEDRLSDFLKAITSNFNRPAGGAGEPVVTIEPPQSLRDFTATLRARYRDLDLVEH